MKQEKVTGYQFCAVWGWIHISYLKFAAKFGPQYGLVLSCKGMTPLLSMPRCLRRMASRNLSKWLKRKSFSKRFSNSISLTLLQIYTIYQPNHCTTTRSYVTILWERKKPIIFTIITFQMLLLLTFFFGSTLVYVK